MQPVAVCQPARQRFGHRHDHGIHREVQGYVQDSPVVTQNGDEIRHQPVGEGKQAGKSGQRQHFLCDQIAYAQFRHLLFFLLPFLKRLKKRSAHSRQSNERRQKNGFSIPGTFHYLKPDARPYRRGKGSCQSIISDTRAPHFHIDHLRDHGHHDCRTHRVGRPLAQTKKENLPGRSRRIVTGQRKKRQQQRNHQKPFFRKTVRKIS